MISMASIHMYSSLVKPKPKCLFSLTPKRSHHPSFVHLNRDYDQISINSMSISLISNYGNAPSTFGKCYSLDYSNSASDDGNADPDGIDKPETIDGVARDMEDLKVRFNMRRIIKEYMGADLVDLKTLESMKADLITTFDKLKTLESAHDDDKPKEFQERKIVYPPPHFIRDRPVEIKTEEIPEVYRKRIETLWKGLDFYLNSLNAYLNGLNESLDCLKERRRDLKSVEAEADGKSSEDLKSMETYLKRFKNLKDNLNRFNAKLKLLNSNLKSLSEDLLDEYPM